LAAEKLGATAVKMSRNSHPPVTLRTERLTLRPFEITDADDVFNYARDREFGRYLPVPDPYTRADAEQYVAIQVEADWSKQVSLAIDYQGSVVGGIDIRIDAADRNAGMGYALARPLWGRGLVTEAAQAVIALAFAEYGLHKVWAHADVRNTASWRVMEKLGMSREGLLREHHVVRGEFGDMFSYGILRTEWERAR
jgi:ribosomal-protein-alanine N-acetyltransferase